MVRICYNAMRHEEGDVVKPLHCVLLASGSRKKDLPFVAKISAMWENPDDGEISTVNTLLIRVRKGSDRDSARKYVVKHIFFYTWDIGLPAPGATHEW